MDITPEMKLALRLVAHTQAAFWKALEVFERVTGQSLDETADFTDFTDPSADDVELAIQLYAIDDKFICAGCGDSMPPSASADHLARCAGKK